MHQKRSEPQGGGHSLSGKAPRAPSVPSPGSSSGEDADNLPTLIMPATRELPTSRQIDRQSAVWSSAQS